MITLKRIAEKYGMACLLHEKPFAGINGSGKHVNWSLGNATQGNLLDPGDTPHENAQFLVFCAAVIRAVHKFSPLLRAVVATAGNEHRLGANEAPPAIISVFLGDQLTDVFEQIKAGGAKTSKARGTLEIGVDTLPPLPKDAGDRNRTSPFAFTGNRFEFRAVGSNQSIAGALVALNTIVADSLDFMVSRLEKATRGDLSKLNEALQVLLKEIIDEHGAVIFNGDGYSEEWHKEAAERGLPNLRTAVDCLPELTSKEVVEIFEKLNVLSKRELHSREEIYIEQYSRSINVESNLVIEMARTIIYPAVVRYQTQLANAATSAKAAGVEPDISTLKKVTALGKDLLGATAELESLKAKDSGHGLKKAKFDCEQILPAMLKVREAADALESIVADDLWPLPTYQEMLFIK